MAEPPTDRETLTRQYADGSSLDARSAIYAYQSPRHDHTIEVVRHLPASPSVVLDVGCGRGQYLGPVLAAGHRAIGVDLSVGMARRAGQTSGAPTLVGDATCLPVDDGAAGAVLAMHMLYHLPDPAAGLRELRRVVAPGGVVLIVTNSIEHLGEYRDLVNEAAGRTLAWPTAPFTTEHRELVESELGPVELLLFEGVVTLTDPEPVVAYCDSTEEFYETQLTVPWPIVLDRVRELSRDRIARDGALRFTTKVGLFVARPR